MNLPEETSSSDEFIPAEYKYNKRKMKNGDLVSDTGDGGGKRAKNLPVVKRKDGIAASGTTSSLGLAFGSGTEDGSGSGLQAVSGSAEKRKTGAPAYELGSADFKAPFPPRPVPGLPGGDVGKDPGSGAASRGASGPAMRATAMKRTSMDGNEKSTSVSWVGDDADETKSGASKSSARRPDTPYPSPRPRSSHRAATSSVSSSSASGMRVHDHVEMDDDGAGSTRLWTFVEFQERNGEGSMLGVEQSAYADKERETNEGGRWDIGDKKRGENGRKDGGGDGFWQGYHEGSKEH